MKDFDGHIAYRKPKKFGSGVTGPFNYNRQAIRPIDRKVKEGGSLIRYIDEQLCETVAAALLPIAKKVDKSCKI